MAMIVDMTGEPLPAAESDPTGAPRTLLRWQSPFDCAITFWRGTSGHAYVHTAYTLAGCPEIPPACVIFVGLSQAEGRRVVLDVRSIEHQAPSLNRAEIRQCGAQLGASEVHLHFAGGHSVSRRVATFDLATRHCGGQIVGK